MRREARWLSLRCQAGRGGQKEVTRGWGSGTHHRRGGDGSWQLPAPLRCPSRDKVQWRKRAPKDSISSGALGVSAPGLSYPISVLVPAQRPR